MVNQALSIRKAVIINNLQIDRAYMSTLFDCFTNAESKGKHTEKFEMEILSISMTKPSNIHDIIVECYCRNLFDVILALTKALYKMGTISSSFPTRLYQQIVSRAIALGEDHFVDKFTAFFPDLVKRRGTYFPNEFRRQVDLLNSSNNPNPRNTQQHPQTVTLQQKLQQQRQQKQQQLQRQQEQLEVPTTTTTTTVGEEQEAGKPKKYEKLVSFLMHQQKLLSETS